MAEIVTSNLFRWVRESGRTCIAAALLGLVLVPEAFGQYKEYPEKRGDVQPFKFYEIPSWMTLDMEFRGRTEGQTAINYVSGNGHAYELTRVRGGLTIRPTQWLTGYLQFHDVHALGLPLADTAANMRDTFDFRQAFLDFHFESVNLFAGRQELKFGGERLVGISDWTNVSRTFDGFDARIGTTNRVDLFSSSVVVIHPTSLDMHAGGLNFHGAYGSIGSWVPRTTIEPYVFVKAMPRVESQQAVYGTETEVTPGMRVVGTIPHNFDYIVEGALQRGSYSNDSIHSGGAYVKFGYTEKHIPWSPHLQGEYDYATGNTHRNLQRISTFDQLYPSAHNVFGLVDLLGWQNIKQDRINLDFAPSKNLTVLLQHGFLQVATPMDGVYNGTGTEFLKPPAGGFKSNDIGREFDASAKYVFHQYWVVNVGVGHFFPGDVMTANQHGAPLTLGYLSLTYRFRVDH